jgi:hypothetical protein
MADALMLSRLQFAFLVALLIFCKLRVVLTLLISARSLSLLIHIIRHNF